MKINKKIAFMAIGISVLTCGLTKTALAHVVVGPGDVRTAAYQTFTVSVPVERDQPTTQLRLEIPQNVTSVTPTAKAGWTIQTVTHGEGDEAMITSITWTGGQIGVGYRDEFTFRAKAPDEPTDLQWRAYQTYQDGTVVSWDQPPDEDEDEEQEISTTGPFSVTKVAAQSDQDAALQSIDNKATSAQQTAHWTLYTSIAGIVLALVGIVVAVVRKRSIVPTP